MRFYQGLLWTTCLLCMALPAMAFDLGQLQVNGFASQGYIKSNDNNYLTPDDTDGTTEFNEIGLTFNAKITEQLRFGAQILSRDLGDTGNNALTLDWGIGDYRLADWLGVRLGKVKTPYGLYNQERDSDFLRPTIFLPNSIYPEEYRDVMNAGVGGSLYGSVSLGVAGSLDYELFYGDINVPDDSRAYDQLLANVPFVVQDKGYDSDYAFANRLIYNTPLEGLRLAGSCSRYKGVFSTDLLVNTLIDPDGPGPAPAVLTPTIMPLDTNFEMNIWVASAEYVIPALTLAAEYSRNTSDIEIPAFGMKSTTKSESYYLLAAVPVPKVDGLTFSTVYSVFYPDMNDRDGNNQPVEDHQAWQKDLGLGLRYDLTGNWLVKGEWHTVNGSALTPDLANPNGTAEDWDYFLLKTTFVF